MDNEQNKSNVDAIYWVITALPMILMNLTPYIDFSLPESIDDDETYRQIVMMFSVAFVLLIVSSFSSIKCFLNSKAMVGKIFASLFFLLYLFFIMGMVYFYLSGYIS